MRRSLALASVVLALALVAGAARTYAEDELAREARCPLDATAFEVRVPVAWNEGGGRDSDGCRWGVAPKGGLFALELRELVACPRCGLALYRAHLERAARAVERTPALVAAVTSELAPLAPVDPARKETLVARAIASYRALGLAALGIDDDRDAFEGRLWLRAAWSVRERIVRTDEPGAFVFAPRSAEDARDRLVALEELAAASRSDASARSATLVDEALAAVDRARAALDPVDSDEPDPARRLRVERARRALDHVERALLPQRASSPRATDAPGLPAGLALAIVRAAVREGDIGRREWWIASVAASEASPLRELIAAEQALLERAVPLLARAALAASGERRAELLVLAADAARRADSSDAARELARKAHEASPQGAAVKRAAFLLERLGG